VHFNPLDLNPLRQLLAQQIDFERLRRQSPFRLFIAATHADSGRLRLFRNQELGVDPLLASGCLPTVFRPPRIEGEVYWDGGYAANPAVFPLLDEGSTRDTLLVLLSPLLHEPLNDGDPARHIHARIAEIAFTASFRREMQALVRERATAGKRWWPLRRWSTPGLAARWHLIESRPALDHLAGETRLAVNLKFFEALHALGRAAAAQWLALNFDAIGRRDSIDLEARFG
jgi:NTE family protein